VKYRRFRVTDYRQIRQGDYLKTWQVGGRTVCEVSRPPRVVERDETPEPPSTGANILTALLLFVCIVGGGASVMFLIYVLAGVMR